VAGTVLAGMRRESLVLLVLLAGCSNGPDADLGAIKQARSLAAEWALINEQASQGKLTATYVQSMHEWLHEQLQRSATSLTQPDSRYGEEIQALLAQPEDAAPEELREHAEKLKQTEDSLESA
jgi:hypothetical protein